MRAVDLFAGLGGWTEGASRAGVHVVWAANHWKSAVYWHSQNHVATEHACQDLRQADWTSLPRFDLLIASPSCRGHSNGRGKERPHHDNERSTAWAVVDCAEQHRPALIVVENVTRFLRWNLYPAWELALRRLGYALSVTIIDSADAGVPQNRQRAFIICTRSKNPLQIEMPRCDHVPVSSIMDQRASWSPVVRPGRAERTLLQWKAGRRDFGARFIMPYYSSGSGLTGRSMNRPLATVTTVERFAVVKGDKMRMLSVAEYRRACGFPQSYKLPDDKRLAVHLLGNAVSPPVAEHIISQLVKRG